MSGALLASQTGALIVPVAHNAGDFWPRRGLVKKPGTVRVVIGPAIATAGRDPRELNREVEEWIEGRMQEFGASRAA
jgi:1-acyl-sn-glycerol-3-phosphate acyltransferase